MEEFVEHRLPTPADLAAIVKGMRDELKWSQATLAEIAGLTERTVQRVENGEPSSFDTRRALAGAFRCEDIDLFNKPLRLPNIQKWKELEKTTVVMPITRIDDARTLRTMWEGATCSDADAELGELSTGARQAFASLIDYLRDYDDIREEYSMAQRLEVDRNIDALLKTITDEGAVVGAGLRQVRVRSKDYPNREPLNWTMIQAVLAPKHALPSNVRVPKVLELVCGV
jgi:transcriptional regulator with XRE-family HTH domain